MKRFTQHNANPNGSRLGDCAVRAIATALDQSWERTYIELCFEGFLACDMPSANKVWGAYLLRKGFHREPIVERCDQCYTVRDFCREYPRGTYVLALDSHVVTVRDGHYIDTWDSGGEVPIYFFTKDEERL